MNKRLLIFTILCFIFFIVGACGVNTGTKQIAFNFKEPSKSHLKLMRLRPMVGT